MGVSAKKPIFSSREEERKASFVSEFPKGASKQRQSWLQSSSVRAGPQSVSKLVSTHQPLWAQAKEGRENFCSLSVLPLFWNLFISFHSSRLRSASVGLATIVVPRAQHAQPVSCLDRLRSPCERLFRLCSLLEPRGSSGWRDSFGCLAGVAPL